MASLIPGYEYDIFISYRRKDNKYDGWVSEFVSNLKKELDATFKEDISIYFDEKPDDGLLESHDVADTLALKLKSLVFIPILSQTYCDPGSFAWQNELLAFHRSLQSGPVGNHVRLRNGNVASRILPVRIRELDAEDVELFEKELGEKLRAVDFIYKTPGVNRPLMANDDPGKNQYHFLYRDQINKVGYAIKDIIKGFQNEDNALKGHSNKPIDAARAEGTVTLRQKARKKWMVVSGSLLSFSLAGYLVFYSFFFFRAEDTSDDFTKSIAVLPFANLSPDPEQDYFSDGVTEDILNHITMVSDLKVKSRTSSQKYKFSKKTIPEIGNELGVGSILQGSVRKHNNKVRIVVQLIDVETDVQVWSVTYDRELEDIFEIQNEIALEIADKLKARLTASEARNLRLGKRTTDLTAYNYLLMAREILDRPDVDDAQVKHAELLLRHAIERDPDYGEAYVMLGEIYFYFYRWNGVSEAIWFDSALLLVSKGNQLDSSVADGYLIRRDILRTKSGSTPEGRKDLLHAYRLAPSNEFVLHDLGWQYIADGNYEEGVEMVLKSIEVSANRNESAYFDRWSGIFSHMRHYEEAKECSRESIRIDPGLVHGYISMAEIYLINNQFDSAIHWYKRSLAVQVVPRVYDKLGWCYLLKGELDLAESSWRTLGSFEQDLEDSTQYYSYRHRLGYIKLLRGERKEGIDLLLAQRQLDLETQQNIRGKGISSIGSHFYDLAAVESMLGNSDKAFSWLDSLLEKKIYWRWTFATDPLLINMRKDPRFYDRLEPLEDSFQATRRAFIDIFKRTYSTNGPLDRRLLKVKGE